MLDIPGLCSYLDERFTKTLFRLDAIDVYNVPGTAESLDRFLAGEPEPDMTKKGPWLAQLRDQVTRGLYEHKVWALNTPLIDRTRLACEWGYAYNVKAGQDIRIFDRSAASWPEQASIDHDFYLIDDEEVLRMHYDDEGHFVGAEVLPDDVLPEYRATRDALWAVAEPFEPWWAARPHEHRANRAS